MMTTKDVPGTDEYDPFVRGRYPVGVRTIQARDTVRNRLFPCGNLVSRGCGAYGTGYCAKNPGRFHNPFRRHTAEANGSTQCRSRARNLPVDRFFAF